MFDSIRKLSESKINTIQRLRCEGYSVKEIKRNLREIAVMHDQFSIEYRVYEKGSKIIIGKNPEKRKFFERIGFLDGSLVTRGNYIGREKNDLLREMLEKHI